MQYVLYEAQNMDSTSEEELIQIDQQWEQNNRAYRKFFHSIESRLTFSNNLMAGDFMTLA